MAKPAAKKDVEGAITILTEGCSFEGKLVCNGTSRIGGTVSGEIFSHGLLIIDQTAHIDARIVGEKIVVFGHVSGEVFAKEALELNATAVLSGAFTCPKLIAEEGAIIDGRVSMSDVTDTAKRKVNGGKDSSTEGIDRIRIAN